MATADPTREAQERQCPPPPDETPQVQDLVGLALSGGGIRSASFNLGVLQGFAERRTLWLFDYLSTVSGGGFIGAWWSAWLSREPRAARDVFPPPEELEPQRRAATAVLLDAHGNAQAVPSLPDGSLIASRADPIHFVRLFSNYLTPKTGALSPDTWRLVAFFVRSLVLTWLALVPLALAAMMLAQAFYLGSDNARAFLCHPIADCPQTLGATLARFSVPLQLVLSAAVTFSLLWLAQSSAKVYLALVGLVAVGVTGVLVLGRVFDASDGFSLHWGVWAVAAVCIALHVARAFRWFERQQRGAARAPVTPADHRTWLTAQLAVVLKWGTLLLLLLLFAGFGHVVLHALATGATDLVHGEIARAGGAGALVVTIVSAAYTLVKAAPSSAATKADPPGKVGRALIAMAPTLVLVLLALCLAALSHLLLRSSIRFDASQVGQGIAMEFAKAAVVFALLELLFALFESFRDPTTPPAAGEYSWKRFLPERAMAWLERRGIARPPPPAGRGRREWFYFFTPNGWVRVAALAALVAAWRLSWSGPAWQFAWDLLRSGEWSSYVSLALIVGALAITFIPRGSPLALRSARPAGLLTLACASAALCILSNGTFIVPLKYEAAVLAFQWIALLIGAVVALGWLADPNLLSLHAFYKARLARAYLGASNTARENEEITDAAPGDDLRMSTLWNHDAGAPYHLVNTTLSLVGASDLATSQRQAENFVMSRYHCGSARAGYRCTAQYMSGRLSLATAAAASGAAVSPTMGSQTPSAALTLMLSLFNMRLGFWAPTPSGRRWNEPHARLWPFYLLSETLSNTGRLGSYCYLTDGGHFDNTGLYALVERGCRYIVVCDCGADPRLGFEDIGVAIRRCRIDFGAEIDLSIDAFRAHSRASDTARTHVVWGRIRYQPEHLRMLDLDERGAVGVIVWVKPSITALNAADVRQYGLSHRDFPQQTTADQWYDESQFESYRRLGYESAMAAFDPAHRPAGAKPGDFRRVADWFAAPSTAPRSHRYTVMRPLRVRKPAPPAPGTPPSP